MTEQDGAKQNQANTPIAGTLDRVLSRPVVVHESQAKRLIRTYQLAILVYGPAALFALFWTSPERFGLTRTQGAWVAVAVGAGAVVGFFVLLKFGVLSGKKSAEPGSAGQAAGDGIRNELRMDSYHEMTVRHARSSFRNSQIAMGLGLLLLTFGAVTVIRSSDVTSQLVVGGLAALGSTFSGFLGRTFLESHKRALEQVNYLFSQPLVSHYLEYSKNVAKDLSKPELCDKALEQVVRRALDSATASVPVPRSYPGGKLDLARVTRRVRRTEPKVKAGATNGDGPG